MEVTLSENSLRRLGDIIAEKILFAKNQPESWIGIDELSSLIKIPKGTIYNWCSRSTIPHKSGKPLRFKLSEVECWLGKR